MDRRFFELGPNEVLDAVEEVLAGDLAGLRATGRSQALNSLENRVYEIELEATPVQSVVTKFYRPGRWTAEQILTEHAFLAALGEVEVPAVAALPLKNGIAPTLAQSPLGIYFAVFPKMRGRILNELDDERLRILGRFIARIHAVGQRFPANARLELNVQNYGWESLDFLQSGNFLASPMGERYAQEVTQLLKRLEDFLATGDRELRPLAIHGDCHLGNTLWLDKSPFILDFDDMVRGPAVQDIWMIIRGRDEEAQRQRQVLLEAYEEFQDFSWSSLRFIEAFRALRMIHYAAWIGRRWEDPSFQKTFPDFASSRYWQEEIVALSEVGELLPF